MIRFAALLDRIGTTPGRNAKLALVRDYLATTPDPDRGLALAVMTGGLSFRHAKPKLLRELIATRVDPQLFALSYDYVGDLSETIALLWPTPNEARFAPRLSDVVSALDTLPASALGPALADWLDGLDETGRWALLKLVTGSLRIGISARLAKTAAGMLGNRSVGEIEEIWHGLTPPYTAFFAWLEGRAPLEASGDPAPFRAPMLAHPLDETALADLMPEEHLAEWKWDGIRVQAVGYRTAAGEHAVRLYSRSGEDITAAFPDVVGALRLGDAALDGELLVKREGRIQPFGSLQQRLNRKTVSRALLASHPGHIRAYDLLALGGEDLRGLPFIERRRRLEAFVAGHTGGRLDLSPLAPFPDSETLADARSDPAAHGAGVDAGAVEGLMIKRRDSAYVAGRPRGLWWKWKRDPFVVDAVLLYAQRGHGKRASFYSDYTFGVWKDAVLVPVGKAYFGFTDDELKALDRFVRNNTIGRFGPVREVRHEADAGLVLEVAFEGLNRSSRNRSGLAMRFPRIARIRWDKPPREAGTLGELEALLADAGAESAAQD